MALRRLCNFGTLFRRKNIAQEMDLSKKMLLSAVNGQMVHFIVKNSLRS
jgi:hypothetical protein